MADTKISALDAVTTPEDSDVLPIVNDDTTKKITVSNLLSSTNTTLSSHIANVSNPHTVTASQVGNSTAQWNADKLQGVSMGTTTPSNGEVLAYNGSSLAWEPTAATAPGAHASTHNEGGSDPITFPTWVASGETWTYASATTFTVSTDLTAKYTKGTKLQLTNDSATKYYYVVSSSYSSPDTTVTVTGEVDLVSGAITSGKYSYMDNPQGFKKGQDWYYLRAVLLSNQPIANDTTTKVLLTAGADPNSNFDGVTNYYYTAPISGFYGISGSIGFDGIANGYRQTSIVRNAGTLDQASLVAPSSTIDLTAKTTQSFFLTKGDTVYLAGYQNSGGAVSLLGNSYLTYLTINFIGV